jgi:hypothetical protein
MLLGVIGVYVLWELGGLGYVLLGVRVVGYELLEVVRVVGYELLEVVRVVGYELLEVGWVELVVLGVEGMGCAFMGDPLLLWELGGLGYVLLGVRVVGYELLEVGGVEFIVLGVEGMGCAFMGDLLLITSMLPFAGVTLLLLLT